MQERLTAEMVRNAAHMIQLDLADDEVDPVRERLQMIFDAVEQFGHLTEPWSELDLRFNANWEAESV